MEQTAAERFLDQINKDSDLQSKLKKVGANFTKVGQEHGFDFTRAQLSDALHKRWSIPASADDPSTPDTCFFIP